MPSSSCRIYIRFGRDSCVRFLAPGNGSFKRDGIDLFLWVRDPSNITRLRNGLRYIYEIDDKEIWNFVEFKLLQDQEFKKQQVEKHVTRGNIVAAFRQQRRQFSYHTTAVDKLEAISNVTAITIIPRESPRKRSDQPGWLYLFDLNQETLEVYEFKDYAPHKNSPFQRLTIKSLYKRSPSKPLGYYLKLNLLDLQGMSRMQWVRLHKDHKHVLNYLWRQNATFLRTIPHADNISFEMLYGSIPYQRNESRASTSWPMRLSRGKPTEAIAALNGRPRSRVSIFERKPGEVDSGARHWSEFIRRLNRILPDQQKGDQATR
ncbi:hypothetical protein F4825DRAFT_447637 [Nemania diffusa]|nr:hypothetical protein F4825DRAFT_447637 [Nemania diffusa]